jgi:hypothetical protein
MKPQIEVPRKSQIEREAGLGAIGSMENGLADTYTLFFQAVKQAARPDKLSRQYTQGAKDSEDAGPRRYDHQDTDGQERKSDENFEEPLRLVNRPNDHSRSPVQLPNTIRHNGREKTSRVPQHVDFH